VDFHPLKGNIIGKLRNVGDFHPRKGNIIGNLRNVGDFHPMKREYNWKTLKSWKFPSFEKGI
jgi:hypothetical protein